MGFMTINPIGPFNEGRASKIINMSSNSDYERFIRLYDSIGVRYVAGEVEMNGYRKYENEHYHILIGMLNYIIDTDDAIALEASNNGKIEGYGGFHTRILFDKEGKFIKQGFWE